MELFGGILHTMAAFFVVISVIVFIHEFGHYIVAKWCGVKIDAFAIGFGKELIGRTDKSGTRWKICLLPLGGYVKMYGDASAASTADEEALEEMNEDEKALTFHHKPLWKKAAIVAAGPIANFILTIGVFCYFIMTIGLTSADPVVGQVMEDSAAQEAGLQAGDRITHIDGKETKRFNDIAMQIATNLGEPVQLRVERGDEVQMITLSPREVESDDGLGNTIKRHLIGIQSSKINIKDVGLGTALAESVKRTYIICETTLKVIGQIITGKRSTEDLKGPVGIAQLSGQAADKDFTTVLWLIAMLSANLGLVNLLPIPLLDGGHLAYYAAEAARGKPLAEKVQEWGFKLGFVMLASLMALTVFNDFRRIVG